MDVSHITVPLYEDGSPISSNSAEQHSEETQLESEGQEEAYDGSRPASRPSLVSWTSVEPEEWQPDDVDSTTFEDSPNTTPPPSSLVEAEENHDDNDSTLQDDAASTASLTPTMLEYRELYDRKYHNFSGASTWEPIDTTQQDFLSVMDDIWFYLKGEKLFNAPIRRHPQKVLDIGTGLGLWAIDFADSFPSAEVIGTDVAPIQKAWVPPNCQFILEDAEELPWVYGDNSLDFIHLRQLPGIKDWLSLFREAKRCLKPGGWLEHTDIEFHPGECHLSWSEWAVACREVRDKTGCSLTGGEMEEWMSDAGLVDIEKRQYSLFDNPAAVLFRHNMDIEGSILWAFHKICGKSMEEIYALAAGMRHELRHSPSPLPVTGSCFWARKPQSETRQGSELLS